MKFKYGKKSIELNINENKVIKTLLAKEKAGIKDAESVVRECLVDPVKSPPLEELLQDKSPENIVIIVNDISRPTPYNILLPPLLDIIHKTGIKAEQITFLVATGVHYPQTEEQSREIYSRRIYDNYSFEYHNPDDNLVSMGKLSSGNELLINKTVVEADFVITTGVILPHYFAGFSGGRKSILPGVAGRETIEYNHSHMVEIMDGLPPLSDNPVNNEMMEAAEKVGVDFILNIVTNSQKEIVEVVAGDYEKAWLKGTKISAKMYHIPINKKADITIVSAGGYPRDINLYQAQKALEHADHCTKEGGTIVWLAECREGLGDEVFARWINDSETPGDIIEKIKDKFVLGGHKAFAISKVVLKKEVILISELDKKTTEQIFAKKFKTANRALKYLQKRYDNKYEMFVMPQGSITVPIIDHTFSSF
ncbi:MAG: nickel-dependent lactate racemase [Halanaerobiales bacterium]